MKKELEEKILKEVPTDDSTSREEKMILYDEIKKLKPEVVIETGTHRGLTTMYMLTAMVENKKGMLHTADIYDWGAMGNFKKFPEHEERVKCYKERGSAMLNKLEPGIEFAFIDGFHEKVEVLEELDFLLPKLANGAVVYFHDTNGRNDYCDVPGAIEEKELKVEYLKTLNGMAKYVHSFREYSSKGKKNSS